MKEVKFRVYDKTNKKMIYMPDFVIAPIFTTDGAYEIVAMKSERELGLGDTDKYVPIPDQSELMQYTGLKDIKKREIYEGDIIEILHHDYLTYHKVVYCAEETYPAFDLEPVISDEWNSLQYAVEELGVAIRGNIYENPDLLKELQNV